MKAILKVLLLSLIFNTDQAFSQPKSTLLNAMEKDQLDTNEKQVIDVTRRLTALMIDKDLVELNRILDTHFTLTHITGYVQSKEDWFSEIKSERMKYYSYKEVKTTVQIDGDKATFVGQNLLDARIWGTRNNWRLQQTIILEKHNKEWIIMKSVATTF
jgi:hypothetical protein